MHAWAQMRFHSRVLLACMHGHQMRFHSRVLNVRLHERVLVLERPLPFNISAMWSPEVINTCCVWPLVHYVECAFSVILGLIMILYQMHPTALPGTKLSRIVVLCDIESCLMHVLQCIDQQQWTIIHTGPRFPTWHSKFGN